jgi:hypothetical protein
LWFDLIADSVKERTMQIQGLVENIQDFYQELSNVIPADELRSFDHLVTDPVSSEAFVSFYYYSLKQPLAPGTRSLFALRACIDTSFDSGQKDLIQRALLKFLPRIDWRTLLPFIDGAGTLTDPRDQKFPFPTAVGENGCLCATPEKTNIWTATWLSMGSLLSDDKKQWYPSEYRTLFIHHFNEDSGSGPFLLGRAPLQGYYDTKVLTINLNARYLNSSAPFPSGTDPDLWAGTIGHEIMHNLGWAHPNGEPGTYIDAVTRYYRGQASYNIDLSFEENQQFLYCDCHCEKSPG